MLEHVASVKPVDRSIRHGQSLYDVAILNMFRKARRIPCVPSADNRNSLEAKRGARVKIDPFAGAAPPASILDIQTDISHMNPSSKHHISHRGYPWQSEAQ